MKKILVLLTLLILLPTSAKALTGVPASIKDNDSDTSLTILIMEGDIIMPEYCSTGNGCTLLSNPDELKKIGKCNFGSGQEYYYIKNGLGATIYEEAGPNPATAEIYAQKFNQIEINAKEFLVSKRIVIDMGNDQEAREIVLVATEPTIVPKKDNTAVVAAIISCVLVAGITIYFITKKVR